MSLVGSLEDLGLGDILQIVSLSRKSGVLRLRCDSGEGRIVLQDGMVLGAAVKGDFEDVKGMLVSGGHLRESQIDEAVDRAGSSAAMADALARGGLVDEEQLESICRARIESAVMGMFDWRTGDFTFEVRDVVEEAEQAVLLGAPLSTQYITMEATRKRDEIEHFGDEPFEDEDPGMLFSGEAAAEDPVVGLAMNTLERVEALERESENDTTQSFDAPPVQGESTPAPAEEPAPAAPADRGHLIAIDPDLGALEWLKASVDGLFERVHIFQRAEIGVDRIRHYLGRGVTPTVLVSHGAEAGRPGGAADLVARLRALSPAMRVAVLVEQGREPGPGFEAVDGILERPASPGSDTENWIHYVDVAEALRERLEPLASVASPRAVPPATPPHPALLRLKEISEQLRDPACESDVLEVVLGFAAESFSRVAIFISRDDSVQAIAQRGLEHSGGPSDAELSAIAFAREDQPEIFRRVIECRAAIVSTLVGVGDERLAALLGSAQGKRVYVAPIESGGCVAALLYADRQPVADAIPDTTALEIALHEAGLALDCALLRRALLEAEGERSA